MSFSRLEVIILVDLGAYAGSEFNHTHDSPARRDVLKRFERCGLIRRNAPGAKWSDGQRDERPWLLTPKGEELTERMMAQEPQENTRYYVDGTLPDGTMMSDGGAAPYRLYDADQERWSRNNWDDPADAKAALQDFLKDQHPVAWQGEEQDDQAAEMNCAHEWNQTAAQADESGTGIYCLKCGQDGDA